MKTQCFYKGIKQPRKLNNNKKKNTPCFYKGIKQQWKLNNNNKRTHDTFISESNNSEN